MTDEQPSLLPATILAEAARVLEKGGYHVQRSTESELGLPSERALLAEDKYGVVVLVVYDTWSDLNASWRDAQASVVEALSRRFTRLDRKAWDGYLVALTPALVSEGETVHQIRYDTTRVRKLVATGEELRTLGDIERTLLPLLPLAEAELPADDATSLLDQLPSHLEAAGVSSELAAAAVRAFKQHEPIVAALDKELFP